MFRQRLQPFAGLARPPRTMSHDVLQMVLKARTQNLIFGIICAGNVKVIPTPRINFLGVCLVLKVKTQNLIFGIIHVGNVKVIPTFRINFSNFPWQLLGAHRPACYTCLMQPAPACVGQFGQGLWWANQGC
jgi:hypothetical protein